MERSVAVRRRLAPSVRMQWFPELQRAISVAGYRPDVDGLRAVAAVSVVLAHAGWLPGGSYGVDIFFVISGFLISGIILQALSKDNFSFIDFYARRVKRIFPALIVFLLATLILGWLILPSAHYETLGKDIAAGAGFVANLWMYLGPTRPTNTPDLLVAHLWTLGIEEQFYMLWPLVLWFAARRKKEPSAVVLAAVVVSFASFLWLLRTNHTAPTWNHKDNAAWLLPWTRLWELAMGGLLACIQLRKAKTTEEAPDGVSRPTFKRHLGAIGVAFVLACLLIPKLWPVSQTCLAATGSFLVIAAGPRYWVNRHVLSAPPLVFVGLLSYPLYLWHQPLLRFCDIVYAGMSTSDVNLAPAHAKLGAIVSAFLLSFVTYKYLELPIRLSKHVHRIACILCVAMACCGGMALLI